MASSGRAPPCIEGLTEETEGHEEASKLKLPLFMRPLWFGLDDLSLKAEHLRTESRTSLSGMSIVGPAMLEDLDFPYRNIMVRVYHLNMLDHHTSKPEELVFFQTLKPKP